jgi:hypothetical protein
MYGKEFGSPDIYILFLLLILSFHKSNFIVSLRRIKFAPGDVARSEAQTNAIWYNRIKPTKCCREVDVV